MFSSPCKLLRTHTSRHRTPSKKPQIAKHKLNPPSTKPLRDLEHAQFENKPPKNPRNVQQLKTIKPST
jgi:hypothetical protein